MRWRLLFFLSLSFLTAQPVKEVGFVTTYLHGQLGNQLFQLATAFAYAQDANLPLLVPQMSYETEWNVENNYQKLYRHRFRVDPLPSSCFSWVEPSFSYTPIPPLKKVCLNGFFQSEKYFKHRREEILSLFAPPEGMREKILSKYPFLEREKLVVGVQIRDYRSDDPSGKNHPTLRRSYYKKAFGHFPNETLFLVSSNNYALAKNLLKGLSDNIVYLETDDYIEEFFTLTLCHSFIISNSSFGWWAAWLCTNPSKQVIAPKLWFGPGIPHNTQDLYLAGWILK